jgi:streptomycin 6-kinase
MSFLNLAEGECATKLVTGDKHSVLIAVVGKKLLKILTFNSSDNILEIERDLLSNINLEGDIADVVWLTDPPQLIVATTANNLYKVKTFDGAFTIDQTVKVVTREQELIDNKKGPKSANMANSQEDKYFSFF